LSPVKIPLLGVEFIERTAVPAPLKTIVPTFSLSLHEASPSIAATVQGAVPNFLAVQGSPTKLVLNKKNTTATAASEIALAKLSGC
jgi:hypothetical protein